MLKDPSLFFSSPILKKFLFFLLFFSFFTFLFLERRKENICHFYLFSNFFPAFFIQIYVTSNNIEIYKTDSKLIFVWQLQLNLLNEQKNICYVEQWTCWRVSESLRNCELSEMIHDCYFLELIHKIPKINDNIIRSEKRWIEDERGGNSKIHFAIKRHLKLRTWLSIRLSIISKNSFINNF